MGHVVRHARILGPRWGFSGSRAALGIGEFSPGSDVVQSLVGSVRALATGGHSWPALRHESCWSFHERSEFSDGLPSLLGCVSRSFSSNSYAPDSLFPRGIRCPIWPRAEALSGIMSPLEDDF